jgi:hypothetical protein
MPLTAEEADAGPSPEPSSEQVERLRALGYLGW